MPYATISIGSNVERETNIRSCIQALKTKYNDVIFSRVFQSKPVGFIGDDFYNLVARFETLANVKAVISAMRVIEETHGRARNSGRFNPRTLDIDLLLYDDLVIDDGKLRLPRKEIIEYAFVLRPLSEIAGDEKHPISGVSYKELWQAFDNQNQLLEPVELTK